MVGLLGYKFGMTQIFDSEGALVPVTVIQTGPCLVSCVRTKEKDGYRAVQLAFGDVREKRIHKSKLGQFKKLNVTPRKFLKEIRTEKIDGLKVGDEVSVATFQPGDYVDVIGVSIGKGFQGVVKRHHFVGGERSHGSMFGRVPGSIGGSSFPSRVFKGMRAAGHMGNAQVTLENVKVMEVDAEKNLLLVRGQVPGVEGNLILIRSSKKLGKKDKSWKLVSVPSEAKEKSEVKVEAPE
ncbi:MAG: 50S ribosomal protein L3, partial [Candidatus Omnitrophica bacterium]|nr:50S ribosomal protein L3 [Candidatus Omnitrophota bacterium]